MWEEFLQFLIPFIIASMVVVVITIIAERYGTRVGGILGTVPSTITVAFVFISVNQGEEFASRAASIVPAEMAINLVFLLIFTMLARRSTLVALLISLMVWIALSGLLLISDLNSILISSLIYLVSVLVIFFLMERILKMRSQGSVNIRYTPGKIAFRGLLAGFIIGTTVVLSNIGEVISGIFSVFPAIFLSTMLITLREHGASFSAGMGKSMILGTQTVMVYAVSIHFLYPEIGTLWGSLLAYLISMIIVMILLYVRKRIS